jgi:sulfopyruvate decarboxylase subunit beta
MLRRDALEAIYPELAPCVVVTIMGAVAAELHALGHRSNFFYLEHAMGLASSMGLGIALSRPELTVVVLDGDGSILMNLGSLTTMARYRPPNLLHVVFDNEVLLSVGQSFTTATATGSDIAAMAAAAGVPHTSKVDTVETFRDAFHAALQAKVLTTLVAKIEPEGPASYLIDVHMLENRFEFQRCLKQMSIAPDPTHHAAGDARGR